MILSRTVYRNGLMLALATISYLCLSSPVGPVIVSQQDKLEHLGAFFILGWLAYRALAPRPWWLAWLLVSGYGGAIELLQTLTPTRQGDWWDLLADSLGALLATLLLALKARRG